MKHITANYTAYIIKKFKNGNAIMTIPDTEENRIAFKDTGKHLPFKINAKNFKKYFI